MFPVYAYRPERWNDVLGEQPLYFIDAATRDVWMAQGALVSITRGKAVRLLRNAPPRPQLSVTMGPIVVMGLVRGASELAEAWSRSYVPYCEYPRQAA